jgi:hypothetical protein
MFGNHGAEMARSGFNMGQAMAAQQGRHLAGMINQTTDAIGEENDRRVALAAELRQMDHQKQMKQMELDSLLARIQEARRQAQPSGPTPRAVFRGGAIY